MALESPIVRAGRAPPGYAIAIATPDGMPRVLCEPACELAMPRGEARIGWRREGGEIEWQRALEIEGDLRLDVRLEDRSVYRSLGYGIIIAGALLIAATAILGIATEPQPPELGWFGPQHGLAFAAIAGGILLAFGIPGVVLSLVNERDTPALDAIPIDRDEPE